MALEIRITLKSSAVLYLHNIIIMIIRSKNIILYILLLLQFVVVYSIVLWYTFNIEVDIYE